MKIVPKSTVHYFPPLSIVSIVSGPIKWRIPGIEGEPAAAVPHAGAAAAAAIATANDPEGAQGGGRPQAERDQFECERQHRG